MFINLSGCSISKPRAIDGKYYMIGDSKCKKYSQKWSLTGNYINCFTSSGKATGSRKAMSDKELQDYVDVASQPVFYPIYIPTYR